MYELDMRSRNNNIEFVYITWNLEFFSWGQWHLEFLQHSDSVILEKWLLIYSANVWLAWKESRKRPHDEWLICNNHYKSDEWKSNVIAILWTSYYRVSYMLTRLVRIRSSYIKSCINNSRSLEFIPPILSISAHFKSINEEGCLAKDELPNSYL